MTRRVSQLTHIEVSRIAISFSRTRKDVAHGLAGLPRSLAVRERCGNLYPRGRRYRCQQVLDENGFPYLYILNFYLPRFLNHSLEEKLSTIVHELWHISPAFDGDIRRHNGRYFVHGSSQHQFDQWANRLAQSWLAGDPPQGIYAFLESDFDQLIAEHGHVCGTKIPLPKLIAVR